MMIPRLLLALLVLVAPLSIQAQSQAEAIKGVPIFETPGFAEQENLIATLIRAGAIDRAANMLTALIRRYPDAPGLQISKALIAVSQKDADAALDALSAASSLGYDGLQKALTAPVFQPLANDARYKALLATPPAKIAEAPYTPGAIKKGIGTVRAQNTQWDPALARLRIGFAFPPTQKAKPFSKAKDGLMAELTTMVRRGQAAGNFGDVYDNRDAGHSGLKGAKDVQITFAKYGAKAKARGLHYGLNETLIFDAVAFGNSSTALKGPLWRSQARQALTTRLGPIRAWQLYDNNHIYVFPEHRDHDAFNLNGKGDVFPANTPLMLISQGSSGTDQRFLKAIQVILAAMKPDVKKLLTRERMIAPVVQQVLRRGMVGIKTAEDYLSPAAHPTVFDLENVRMDRMMRLANGLDVDALPPRAQIAVTQENIQKGPLASSLPEQLFTTPDAIARAWRGAGRFRQYSLSAAASSDLNGLPLTYFWRVLRGDPAKVKIARVTPDAAEVSVTVEWHEGMRTPNGIASSRVDIALFAFNGVEYSAPAFFSLDMPLHQKRVYHDDPADERPLSISYIKKKGDKSYADPVIWPSRDWNDVYHYDANGRMLGWTRTYGDGQSARFTQHGLKATELDVLDRPVGAALVRYQMTSGQKGRKILKETAVGRSFVYSYANDTDLLGALSEVKTD